MRSISIPTINPGYFPASGPSQGYEAMSYKEESPMEAGHVVSSEAIKNLQRGRHDKALNTITSDMADENGKIPEQIGPFAEYNRLLEQRAEEFSNYGPQDSVPGTAYYHEETALDVAHYPVVTREMIWKLREEDRNTIRADKVIDGKLPADIGPFAHINLNSTTIWSKGSRTLD